MFIFTFHKFDIRILTPSLYAFESRCPTFYSSTEYISETMKLGASLPAYRSFSIEELKEATNNFDASNLMGEGSNGQVIISYKAEH